MGKRELGLILAFVVAGVIIWQVTAPKAEGPGFSMSGWLSNARKEMRGRHASAEVTSAPSIPVDATIQEIRLSLSGEITIIGEDREDVGAELKVVSNGFDDAEAKKLAEEAGLKVSKFADSIVIAWAFPDPGRQEPKLTLRVPARLRIQLDGRGTASVTGVGAVTLARSNGEIQLKDITGLVKGEHRSGTLVVEGAQAVDLYAVSTETTISGVREDLSLNSRGGEARIAKMPGKVTITAGDSRVRVDGPTGMLRAEIVDGELDLRDTSSEIDIDARDTPVTVAWSRVATTKIQVREGSLEITLPSDAASYSLDARMSGGELRVPDSLQKTTEGEESSVTKTGGPNAPAIFVRGTGSAVTIR
ncbi:MAG: DUF4097 family beta strand repeat-containing protein [Acidobacteriota bacterium]|nr:DUF4097 family beta strand repeat-containing protein [Acidobacteriota bacterium]